MGGNVLNSVSILSYFKDSAFTAVKWDATF